MAESSAQNFVEQELYDLAADPYELENLIHEESHRVVADVLRQRLNSYMERIEGITPTVMPPIGPITRYQQRSVPKGDEQK